MNHKSIKQQELEALALSFLNNVQNCIDSGHTGRWSGPFGPSLSILATTKLLWLISSSRPLTSTNRANLAPATC